VQAGFGSEPEEWAQTSRWARRAQRGI
jgi:hypothetical protein